MNKFFIAAASALALASCSSDDFLGEIQGNEQNGATSAINFGGDTGKITRATSIGKTAAELLGNNFVVVGFKNNEKDAANNKVYAFDHYNVNFKDDPAFSSESNRAGWEYVNQDMTVKGTKPAASLAQSGVKQQTIKYWDHSCASYDFIAFSMGKGAASEYATPTHVDKDKFGAVNYKNQAEGTIPEGTTYLSQNAAKPSSCGAGYQNVLPSEGAASAITLRIDYKLTSVDGSNETINVKGATATVPAEYTEWKSGYAYTYIFKISPDTNGSTGGSSTGLTAISFDAVVVDDEANGLQETITTVSDNSFTTYGYKDNKVTTNGNEYVNGTDIYATVYSAGATVAPQKLYTVTLEAGATQTINEASVANALEKGSNDTAKKTWTVTDYAGKKMVVTETADGFATTVTEVPAGPGYSLKVNALKWKGVATDPDTETYYAVEYNNGTKKSYKIVKVVNN